MELASSVAKQRRVTVADVAARAQVSTATVSRALSGARNVDPALRLRVIGAAQELGYRPNLLAKALRQRTTQTVGFVVPDVTNPYFPALIEALENKLTSHGISLLLCHSANDFHVEQAALEALIDRNVDAIFVSPCHRDRSAAALLAATERVPVIQVDRFASPALPFVGTDHASAIGELVRAEVARFGEVGFVGSNPDEWPYFVRERAYRSATSGASSQRVMPAADTIAAGREIGAVLPDIWPGVRGIICANDLLAFGCLAGLRARWPELADEYEITGFDDTVVAEAGQLTTVRQPVALIAQHAVDIMLGAPRDVAGAAPYVELEAEIVRHDG